MTLTRTLIGAHPDTGAPSSSEADGVVTVWLSHGTLGARPKVTCHITTNEGRTDDRSFTVLVQDR